MKIDIHSDYCTFIAYNYKILILHYVHKLYIITFLPIVFMPSGTTDYQAC